MSVLRRIFISLRPCCIMYVPFKNLRQSQCCDRGVPAVRQSDASILNCLWRKCFLILCALVFFEVSEGQVVIIYHCIAPICAAVFIGLSSYLLYGPLRETFGSPYLGKAAAQQTQEHRYPFLLVCVVFQNKIRYSINTLLSCKTEISFET